MGIYRRGVAESGPPVQDHRLKADRSHWPEMPVSIGDQGSDPLPRLDEASQGVYAVGPAALPNSAFLPGRIAHLRPGRTGRVLDPRRTPVRVIDLDDRRGYFQVEIMAFEDAGATWLVPLEQVTHYQFSPGEDLPAVTANLLTDLAVGLSADLTVPPGRGGTAADPEPTGPGTG